MIAPFFRLLRRRVVTSPPAGLRVAALMIAVLAYGTTGFLYFEQRVKPDLSWADSLWWSVVTMSTIGYGDYYPSTPGGRFLVATPMMFFGIGLLGYVLSLAATALVESKNKELHGMGTVKSRVQLLIFNFPNLGKVERVVDELRHDDGLGDDGEVVLVDEDLEELPPELVKRGMRYVRGNPSRDETLTRAGIDTATHAIVLSKRPGDPHSDDLNLAVTLAIEARRPEVRTTVECVDVGSQELLRKAGCDSIVCISRLDAHFISKEVVQPGVQDVVDDLLSSMDGQQLYISPLDPMPKTFELASVECRAQGHLAIGVHRKGETMLNSAGNLALVAGDRLITIGAKRMRPSRGN